jgi:hypothetical protein
MTKTQFIAGLTLAFILLLITVTLLSVWVSVPDAEGYLPTRFVECINPQGTPVPCNTPVPSKTAPPPPIDVTPQGYIPFVIEE